MRDKSIDFLKGICILLVILGHALYDTPLFSEFILAKTTYNFIYSFHMPLFFCISGYLTNVIRYKKPYYILKYTLSYYIVYLIIVFSYTILTQENDFNTKLLYYPLGSAWFLLALFILKFVWTIISNWFEPTLLLLLSLSVFYIIMHYNFSYWFPILFLPSFAIGFCLRNIDTNNPKKFSIIIMCSFLLIVFMEIKIYGIGADTYQKNIIGSAIFILFLGIKNCFSRSNIISYIGENSIIFYVINSVTGKTLAKFVNALSLPYYISVFIYFVTTTILGLLIIHLMKYKLLKWIVYIFNPSKFLNDYQKREAQ